MDQTPSLVQSLSPGAIVELYTLDMSPIGYNTQLYFSPSYQSAHDLSFGGQLYTSAAIKITGFKKNSDGTAVQPSMAVPNVNNLAVSLLQQYGGLIGAKITRRRTFSMFLDFLDDGVTANPFSDPSSQFIPEVWWVEQKTDHNRTYIKWNLASVTDFDNKFLPTRRIWKDLCERTYRYWDPTANAFNYQGVTCPYTGGNFFDINGSAQTNPAFDSCGKDYKNCNLRFPNPDVLPGYFFPGVQRLQGYMNGSGSGGL